MPLPTPRQGESRDDFISRCMENDTVKREFPDPSQRSAVCYRQARRGSNNGDEGEGLAMNLCTTEDGQELVALQGGISLVNATRRQWLGQEYVVAPVVLMVEGVHCGSAGCAYYPAEELEKFPEAWNNRPLSVSHPQDRQTGAYISCNDPDVIEQQCVGRLFNVRYDHPRLRGEIWINVERCRNISPEVFTYINSNRILPVSTGLFNDWERSSGTWCGEDYDAIVRNIRPDHLALLPGGVGACSVEDGCGVRVNSATVPGTEVPMWRKRGDETAMSYNKTVSVMGDGGSREWLALRRLSKSWLTDNEAQAVSILINELGYTEIASKIQRKLDVWDGEEKIHYLEELFNDSFIYRVNVRGHEAAEIGADTVYYRRAYSVNPQTGEVSISGESTRVRKEVTYTPIPSIPSNTEETEGQAAASTASTPAEEGTTTTNEESKDAEKETNAMVRKERVDALIANTSLPYKEEDREMLLALEDPCFEQVEATCNKVIEQIAAREASMAETVTNVSGDAGDQKSKQHQEGPQSLEQWLDQTNAPVEFKSMILNSVQHYQAEREKKIQKIVDNSQFTAEELRTSQDQFLDRLHETISKPVYLGGGGGGQPTGNRFEGEEPLELPTINWKE